MVFIKCFYFLWVFVCPFCRWCIDIGHWIDLDLGKRYGFLPWCVVLQSLNWRKHILFGTFHIHVNIIHPFGSYEKTSSIETTGFSEADQAPFSYLSFDAIFYFGFLHTCDVELEIWIVLMVLISERFTRKWVNRKTVYWAQAQSQKVSAMSFHLIIIYIST